MYTISNTVLLIYCLILFKLAISKGDEINYRIPEEQPIGTFVGNFKQDFQPLSSYNAQILDNLRFSFKTESPLFEIDKTTGIITQKRTLNRETLCPSLQSCRYELIVIIRPFKYYTSAKIIIHVDDINDNDPKFPQQIVQIEISEDTPSDASFKIPGATDLDAGIYGIESYYLENNFNLFRLSVTNLIDGSHDIRLSLREKIPPGSSINLTIIAADGGDPSRLSSILVMITYPLALDSFLIFERNVYESSVLENGPKNELLVRVSAKDIRNPDSKITYSLSADDDVTAMRLFRIDEETGFVYSNGLIDYEEKKMFRLKVSAEIVDNPSASSAHAQILIRVIDLNDNSPVISISTLTSTRRAEVMENSPRNTFVAHVAVEDKDSQDNSRVACILQGTAAEMFSLNKIYSNEYKITTKQIFDREETAQYTLSIHCQDEGTPQLNTSRTLLVDILDENDNDPIFSRDNYAVSVEENDKIKQAVIEMRATDIDSERNGELVYSISFSDSHTDPFSIERVNGVVYTTGPIDYELNPQYTLIITATDQGVPPRSASATLIINVIDRNDNFPEFSQEVFTFKVNRGSQTGEIIGTVHAIDQDTTDEYRDILYQVSNDKSNMFSIVSRTGMLFAVKDLNEIGVYEFVVTAFNNESSPYTKTTVNVIVEVVPYLPVVMNADRKNGTIILPLSSNLDSEVTCLKVTYEYMAFITYEIEEQYSNMFYIDATGCVRIKDKLITAGPYNLKIKIFDNRFNMEEEYSTILNITILVTNSTAESSIPLSIISPENRLVVVIGVGCGMGALLLIVVVSIVAFLRTQNKNRRNHRDSLHGSDGQQSEDSYQLREEMKGLNEDEWKCMRSLTMDGTSVKNQGDIKFRALSTKHDCDCFALPLAVEEDKWDKNRQSFYMDNKRIWMNTGLDLEDGSLGSRRSRGSSISESVPDSGKGLSEDSDSMSPPGHSKSNKSQISPQIKLHNSEYSSNHRDKQKRHLTGNAEVSKLHLAPYKENLPAHQCGLSLSNSQSSDPALKKKSLIRSSSQNDPERQAWLSTFKGPSVTTGGRGRAGRTVDTRDCP